MAPSIATSQTIMLAGGGISGMSAGLAAAECGKQVILMAGIGRTRGKYSVTPNVAPHQIKE